MPADATPLLLRLLGFRPRTDSLVGQSPEAIRTRTIDLLRQLTLLAGRRQPVVCAVEDLQWIDQSSEAALAALVDGSGVERRPPPGDVSPGLPTPLAGQVVRQSGRPGPADPGREPRRPRVRPSGKAAPLPVQQRIVARAEGVPLFIEELARAVVEGAADTPASPVPDTIEDVLAARLGRLSQGDRDLLQVASVIGRDVSVAILEAVSHRPEAELRIDLARLQSAEFLHEVLTASGSIVTFKHALTHEVTYGSLLEPRRRRLHGDVAAAIARIAPQTVERRPEVLAYHPRGRRALSIKTPRLRRGAALRVPILG